MAKIWAKRLVAGTQTWDRVPQDRKNDVLAILKGWAADGTITAEQFEEITGEAYGTDE